VLFKTLWLTFPPQFEQHDFREYQQLEKGFATKFV